MYLGIEFFLKKSDKKSMRVNVPLHPAIVRELFSSYSNTLNFGEFFGKNKKKINIKKSCRGFTSKLFGALTAPTFFIKIVKLRP